MLFSMLYTCIFECFVLPGAVCDQLLLALQGSLAQQVLAAQALLALVAAESARRPTQTQACVPLPGGSQQHFSRTSSAALCTCRSSQIDRLLQKGLVTSLQRILSTPVPKPFWPRWLQRDVNPASKETVVLFQLQLHALQILTLLSSCGADTERHIAGNKVLMDALERIATRSFSPRKPYTAALSGKGEQTCGSLLAENEQASQPVPTAGACEEGRATTGELRVRESYNATEVAFQKPEQSAAAQNPHAVRQDSGGRPLSTQGQSIGVPERPPPGVTQALQPAVAHPGCNGPIHEGAVPADGDPAAKGGIQQDALPLNGTQPTSSIAAPAPEKQVRDTRMLRASAERLAFALLTRLGVRAGAVEPGELGGLHAGERPPVDDARAVKSGWWTSFLLPLRIQKSGASPGYRVDGMEKPTGTKTAADLPASDPLAHTEDQEVGQDRGQVASRESDALFKPTAQDAATDPAQEHIGARISEYWKRLFSVVVPHSLKNMASKKPKLNSETKAEIFWIPLCLSAGDAGVWAAIAAVAGEDLAAALKQNVAERAQRSERHLSLTGGPAAGSPPLNSEFLSLLDDVRIERMQPSASLPATCGILGITTTEERHSELQVGGAQQAAEDAMLGRELIRSSRTAGDAVLAGDVAIQNKRMHFRTLCLLTGHQPFQDSVETLAIRALLDAAAIGKPETKMGALQALSHLIRKGPPCVTKKVLRELQSETPTANIRLRALEESLAKAVIAPYSGQHWWDLRASKADHAVLKSLQVAALDFLYALCTNDEEIIQSLQAWPSIRTAVSRVARFCTSKLTASHICSAASNNGSRCERDSGARLADEAQLLKVANMRPPGERHTRVLQEHARPLRLATIISSALGGQPKWSPRVAGQRGLRILALDGGGTRGVLTVALLKHIAAAVGRELSEVFDIICGTSTGGIIAVLLGMEKASTAELEALYDALIGEIFVKDSAAVAGARLVVRQAYYDESLWESLLQRAFGDTRMIDFAADASMPKVFCLSTMVSTSPAKLVVWRNYNYPCGDVPARRLLVPECFRRIMSMFQGSQAPGMPQGTHLGRRYEGSCCVRVRDALRATTAAPGFFIGKKVGNELFVDGALLANNPAAVAIAEAKALYPDVPIEAVVSIGTGQCAPERCDTRTGWDGIFNQLVNAATNTESIHELLTDLLPHSVYFRFNPEIDAVSIDETSKERLDELKLVAKRFFEDPRNKEVLQGLADILRPASPLQKRSRSLVRTVITKTNSLGRRIQQAGVRAIQAMARSFQGPVTFSDPCIIRLIKCCLISGPAGDDGQAVKSRSIVRWTVRDAATETGSKPLNAAAAPSTHVKQEDFAAPTGAERPQIGAETVLKDEAPADGAILNLDGRVVAGGRRSFLAWLLRSPRSKLGPGSTGTFDMLELLGRRHLSSVHEREEMETLVPLTGVRHVLHGIFQHIRSRP